MITYLYLPLYNRNTHKRESFILLSSGPDGKINTLINPSDSVYMDNWWEKIAVYNYYENIS